MKKVLLTSIFSIVALFFFSWVSPVHAMEFINGDAVSVPKDQTIDSSVFISGNSVRVEGEVNGDVFCTGKDITITGPVHGDVLCAGQTVQVNNVTDGNVRVAGQTVTIAGTVGENLNAAGQTVTVSESGSVTGEMLTAAQTLQLHGWVGRDLQGWTDTAVIDGEVDKNVSLDTNSLSVGDGAYLAGNVQYTSDQKATVSQSASVSGTVVQTTPAPDQPKPAAAPVGASFFQGLHQLASGVFVITTLLVGALLVFLFPKGLLELASTMREHWPLTFLRGLVVAIVVPVVILILVITLIGIPAGFLLGAGFIVAYFVGRILSAVVIGQLILESLYKDKSTSPLWCLFTGALVLWAAFTIPMLSDISSLLITLFGFGGITYIFFKKR